MSFGPSMNLVATNTLGQHTEVELRAMELSDLSDLPDIATVPQAQQFTSPHFVKKVASLKERDGGEYYRLMRDGNEGWYWGIFVDNRALGVTGYNEITNKAGPESFTMLLGEYGRGIGNAVALARTAHAFDIAGFGRIRAEVNVENQASYKAVTKLGYTCLHHRIKYGQERHELTLFHPDITPIEKTAPIPFHGVAWPEAQRLVTLALARAYQTVAVEEPVALYI